MGDGASAELKLAAKFAGVSLIGFATDALLLQLLGMAGLSPAWSRLISLTFAMQVTFAINLLHVFRGRDDAPWPRQWGRYMLSNGFGNVCNYWIFVTMVSTHWPVISTRLVALCVAAFCAWVINFTGARLWVFRRTRLGQPPLAPDAIEPS